MCRVLFPILSILLIVLSAFGSGSPDGPKGKPVTKADHDQSGGAQSKLTAKNFEKVKSGKGKLTEAEVVAILGPATRVAKPEDVDVDLEMIWEEKARIWIKFKDDKARGLQGQFSEHLKSKTINLESFKKLKKGMSEKEVEKVIGPANEGSSPGDGVTYRTWEKLNHIKVQFKDGKVSGYLQMRSTKG
jgi:hypothetical protein